GVADDLKLYALTFSGTPRKATCTELRGAVDKRVTPAAIVRSDNTLVAVAVGPGPAATRRLLGFHSNAGTLSQQSLAEESIGKSSVAGDAIDGGIAQARGVFAACLGEEDGTTRLSRWSPFEPTLPSLSFDTSIPPNLGPAAGAPVVLPAHFVV